ncbi:hypothetical protein BY458DRAFT_515311 [Sporodiniella umbellata]|nr:hypothetical protein BY458DRAFT_515311 [Sporodiniella umbellata]
MRPARVLNTFISSFVAGYDFAIKQPILKASPTCFSCGRLKPKPFRFHPVSTIYTKVASAEPCISIIKLAQQGRSRDALLMYFKIIEQEKVPSREALYQLAKALYKTNNLVGMHALHNTLAQVHSICPPSDRARRSLTYIHIMFINLIARTTRDIDAILKVCDMISDRNKRGNTIIYNVLIKVFLEKGEAKKASKIYEELKREGSPSIATFHIWIREAQKKRDFKAVMYYLDEMKLFSITPDRKMVYQIVSALCNASQFLVAKDLVERLHLESRTLVPKTVCESLLSKIAECRQKKNRQRESYSVNKKKPMVSH